MEIRWDVMYLWDIEISLYDFLLLVLNVIFFAVIVGLFLYYTNTEDKGPSEQIALSQFCNLGEGATSKFFTIKGPKDGIQRRKPGNKTSAPMAKDGKYAAANQVELKCNYCKSSFFLCPKRK